MATSDIISGGNIEPRGLEEEMRSSYLDYAMSVIVGRALPDARDGLKPVHRRVLYAMNENGLQPNRPYAKSARIVGEVMGKYHPHGDSAIYDTLVRMAQEFSMSAPLVDGQGNFGSIDDDPAAAMRYTEARLSPIAREMLRDLDADTVNFQPNYDGNENEPVVLPSRFPNLLVNGSSGIAVGMATNIPPHNLREVIAATIAYIDDPDIDTVGLMQHMKGPDFPTGGVILGLSGIRDAFETGRGRVRVRARAHIEPIGQGKEAIIVTELPYQVKKGGETGLIRKIADLHAEKKLTEITNIEDHSDRKGMRVVIELKRDANPKVVLNKLYKHTQMQTTFGVNTVALVDNVPRTLPLRGVIHFYVQHQREVIVRRSKHELRSLEARVHRLEGLLIALDHLDAVIELIRGSRDRDTARTGLMERFELTHVQAQAILELRLQQLTALEADTLRREHADLVERIRELRELLGDEDKVLALIKEELQEISERYGQRPPHEDRAGRGRPRHRGPDRRPADGDLDHQLELHQVAAAEHLPPAAPRRRGDHRDGDEGGRLHRAPLRVLDARLPPVLHQPRQGLPLEGLRPARGRPHLQGPLPGQRAAAARRRAGAVRARDARLLRDDFLMFAHPPGHRQEDRVRQVQHADQGRRHHRDQHPRRRRAGRRAARRPGRRDPDGLPRGPDRALPRGGRRARLGRDTSGVRGMDVSGKNNYVLAMDVAQPGNDLLVVTENGYGKRTGIDEYRLTSRGAKGVKTINFTESKGLLAAALVVKEHQDLVFISQNGIVQRTGVRGINRYGRTSQGVRVMKLRDGDEVSAVALVVESETPADGDAAGGGRRGARRSLRGARGRRSTRSTSDVATATARRDRRRRGRRPKSLNPRTTRALGRGGRPLVSLLWHDQRKGVVRS